MPTAGRLAGAITFGVFGLYLATLLGPLFGDSTKPKYWLPLCIAAGVFVGWLIVGPKTGRGYSSSIGIGLTGAVSHAFWIVFVIAFFEMVAKSLRRNYDGPMEALVGIFDIFISYAQRFATSDVAIAIVAGGIVCGFISEYFGRRFG